MGRNSIFKIFKQDRNSSAGGITLAVCLTLFVMIAGTFYLQSRFSSATEMPQASVEILQDGFLPPTIYISVGSQVTWINNDSLPHQITSQQLIGPRGPEPMATGESYSYIFERAGTYGYYDQLGSQVLQGTVVVK